MHFLQCPMVTFPSQVAVTFNKSKSFNISYSFILFHIIIFTLVKCSEGHQKLMIKDECKY